MPRIGRVRVRTARYAARILGPMRCYPRAVAFCLLCLLSLKDPVAAAADAKPFELLEGDRVVFIGGTFIEREQSYSYLETLLRTYWPERKMIFRNLGWSGDNVFGASRGYFEGADSGFARLAKTVHEIKPTVIFIGYGMTESFEGEAGLANFRSGLERMLDMLKDLNARETVLIAPIQHENLGPPLPDPAEHNKWLRAYSKVIEKVAADRSMRFVDAFELAAAEHGKAHLTDNGIHLTQDGYWRMARAICASLKVSLRHEWPVVPYGSTSPQLFSTEESRTLEKIRLLFVQKNLQFFNQWRPANETYIFGFRAKEQGKNAAEMPQFAKPIEKLEEEITKLAQRLAVTREK